MPSGGAGPWGAAEPGDAAGASPPAAGKGSWGRLPNAGTLVMELQQSLPDPGPLEEGMVWGGSGLRARGPP